MWLATLNDGTPDGALVVVSRDGSRLVRAGSAAASLLGAIDKWSRVEPELRRLAEDLERGGGGEPAQDADFAAPLPRSWQWLDGSAFPTHGELMQLAFGLPPIETDRPLMYQGMSDRFLGPRDDVPLPSEADGIDFEGEFGVIVDAVPMGASPAEALRHIKLVVQQLVERYGWDQGAAAELASLQPPGGAELIMPGPA